MLDVKKVSYCYRKGGVPAVKDADASIGPGVYLLLGENGAGKTTLFHLMCGLLFPKEGECSIDGVNTASRIPDTMRRIFFLSDNFEFPYKTINEMAIRHGQFYPKFSMARLAENLNIFGMEGEENLKNYSLGWRRKAYVAYAFALGVDYLLLDEPANGMDIHAKKGLCKIIGKCVDEDQCVMIATHNVHDLQTMFDHVMVMRKGSLRLAMPLYDVLERVAFVTSSSKVDGAIYQELDMGRFKAIVPNEEHIETDVDYPLLYSALMSPVGDSFIEFLNT